jgi:hypothetical protein
MDIDMHLDLNLDSSRENSTLLSYDDGSRRLFPDDGDDLRLRMGDVEYRYLSLSLGGKIALPKKSGQPMG